MDSAFFYILSALENPADLLYVAQITGIPELGDIRYVRNIYGILSIKDIYKVGYLANGVASVINKYSTIFAASAAAANPTLTTFGDVEQARNITPGEMFSQGFAVFAVGVFNRIVKIIGWIIALWVIQTIILVLFTFVFKDSNGNPLVSFPGQFTRLMLWFGLVTIPVILGLVTWLSTKN
jgi:hypothetical protein